MNIEPMTDQCVEAIYRDWFNSPLSTSEIELIKMAVAARDAQYAAQGQEPVAHVCGDDVKRYLQWANVAAFDYPIGTPVYTHPAPTNPAAQIDALLEDCGFEVGKLRGGNPAAQERAEPVAPAVGEALENARHHISAASLYFANGDAGNGQKILGEAIRLIMGVEANRDRAALSATPPAPAQPERTGCSLGCTEVCKAKEHGCASECPALPWQPQPLASSDPEGHRQAIADHEAESAQPSPEPSKPEQAEAPINHRSRLNAVLSAFGPDADVQFHAVTWEMIHGDITALLATLPPASAAPKLRLTMALDDGDTHTIEVSGTETHLQILDRFIANLQRQIDGVPHPEASAAGDSGAGEREASPAADPAWVALRPEEKQAVAGSRPTGERELFEVWRRDFIERVGDTPLQWEAWQARAALATKPQAEQESGLLLASIKAAMLAANGSPSNWEHMVEAIDAHLDRAASNSGGA